MQPPARGNLGSIAVASAAQRPSVYEVHLDNSFKGQKIRRGDFACREGGSVTGAGREVLIKTQVTLLDKFGNINLSVNGTQSSSSLCHANGETSYGGALRATMVGLSNCSAKDGRGSPPFSQRRYATDMGTCARSVQISVTEDGNSVSEEVA